MEEKAAVLKTSSITPCVSSHIYRMDPVSVFGVFFHLITLVVLITVIYVVLALKVAAHSLA